MIRHYIQQQLSKNRIEIGVSKACCSWGIDYLNLLAAEFPKHPVLVRASHGKQPDGWLMPPDGPRTIVHRIDNAVWKIRNRRRSDSNELPGEILGESEPDFEATKETIFDFDFE